MQTVSLNLLDIEGRTLKVTFPDVPGEEYRDMWEQRRIDQVVAGELSSDGLLLMVNSDNIVAPTWAMEHAKLSEQIGTSVPSGPPLEWDPAKSPTQVQLVELLQLLRQPPLDVGPRRLAIMISAWDKAQDEGLEPSLFLKAKLPLLFQYLVAGRDAWLWRVYGVSAQGGEYDGSKPNAQPSAEAEALRELEIPSSRIRLVDGTKVTHDLTEPLEWLIQ